MQEKTPSYKIIFHIDLNSFFASCAISEDPSLANKPVAIAHLDVLRKSIILTSSYEARKYGIKTTMMVREAIPLCPHLIIVEPNFALYQKYSNLFFTYLTTITPKLEITSIDEGYLDVTEVCEKISALDLAAKIQNDLLSLYKLPCSIGIAPNKFLAKMASDLKKPLGITVLRKREIAKYLWPLPIKAMMGVGKKTEPRLQAIGINTIGDIVEYKDYFRLEEAVGKVMAEYLQTRAQGIDESEVNYKIDDEVSSISRAHTFYTNVNDVHIIKDTLKVLANTVSDRLYNRELYASNIGIQLKFANFHSISRSRGLSQGLNDPYLFWEIIEDLFEEYYDGYSEIRLIGVFATRFVDNKQQNKQISIFDDFNKLSQEEELAKILKNIKNEYGNKSIKLGFYKYEKEDD